MCCTGFLKMMMFIFNGGIFLAGAAILGVGIWVKVDSASLLGILENLENGSSGLSQLVNVSYVLMAVGGVLLVIGFLGCCGAIKESKCMLLTFFSIVLIIFLIEVAGAVVLFVFKGVVDELLNDLETEVISNIRNEYGENESVTSIWNNTMEELKCCGYKNYTDFTDSPFFHETQGHFYPTMCCTEDLTTDGKCSTINAENSEIHGCYDTLVQLIEDNATIVAAVALGIAALEIAAMVVSMVLYKDIK